MSNPEGATWSLELKSSTPQISQSTSKSSPLAAFDYVKSELPY